MILWSSCSAFTASLSAKGDISTAWLHAFVDLVSQKHISGRKFPTFANTSTEAFNTSSCRGETFDESETNSHGPAAPVT
jgi:hypothetical protein